MPVLSSQWPTDLDPVIRYVFDQRIIRMQSKIPMLFDVMTSANSDEVFSSIGDVDIKVLDHFEKTREIPEMDFSKGYDKIFHHTEFAAYLRIERKFLDDNKSPRVTSETETAASLVWRKRETDAASVFNNAFSASFPGGDGVALCSTSHPAGPDNPSKVQSNAGTDQLTEEKLSDAIIALEQLSTDKNDSPLGAVGNLLIVGSTLGPTARKLVGSELEPETGNNAINANDGMSFAIWPFISGKKWFVADQMLMRDMLKWIDRVPPELTLESTAHLYATWLSYMRYSYGFAGWQWVYGNNPA